jgi:DTW domain-containing protein YfiP
VPHAVARLRAERLARCTRLQPVRGSRRARCERCRMPPSHCPCDLRPVVPTRAGFALLMHDVEALKPSNTGWLVADVVPDTWAFEWSRTAVDRRLPALLADAQWQPYVVFPEGAADPARVVRTPAPGRRPLFVLLDGSWRNAHKMFHRSPYLDHLPVLAFRPEELSRYRLRHPVRDVRLCTAEAAALCLGAAGEERAARALDAWLDVFVARSMAARVNAAPDLQDEAHQRLAAIA